MMAINMKALTHAVLAGMLLSSAAAQRRAPSTNSARCRISGTSVASSQSAEVAVAVTAEATAYLCADPDTPRVETTALGVAEEIANATASAIATVYATCTATGSGTFLISGRSLAQAEAFTIARSFAEGLVEASVCEFCDIAADFIAESFEQIIITATAEAEVVLEGAANGGSVEASAEVLAEQFVAASTTAFAQVIIAATADVNGGCTGDIIAVVGGSGDTCTVSVGATDASIVEDADTELIVDLFAEACGADEDVIVDTNATTTAIATAMARAIAEISASCDIQGDTTACVVSEADITTTATAVASSFAFVILDARSTCDPPLCETSTEVLTEAFETILAEAAASAVFAQCSTTGDTFSTTVLSDQIVTATATSLTTVIAQVSVIGGVCDFDADVSSTVSVNPPTSESTMTTTSDPVTTPATAPATPVINIPPPTPATTGSANPSTSTSALPTPATPTNPTTPAVPTSSLPKCGAKCARTNRQCDGVAFDAPVACCGAQDLCVRRNSRFSQCRLNGIPPSRRWDGTIVQCQA